jgi:small GTP-binding protein
MEFGSRFAFVPPLEDAAGDGPLEYIPQELIASFHGVAMSRHTDTDADLDLGHTDTCLLDILDTAGQEEYSAMRDQYVRQGDGFLVVYSVTCDGSFREAAAMFDWIQRVRDTPQVPVVLCGNKVVTRMHGR